MTIKQGTSYLDRPPHETTEATRRFEEELDRETEEAATDELREYAAIVRNHAASARAATSEGRR